MDNPTWGATPYEWAVFSAVLGLTADLLPVVSNPHAEISPDSKMKALGKTPSRYNGRGHAVGIANWTSLQTTNEEISRWEKNPDYGICIQTRHVRAIDCDLEDVAFAATVEAAIARILGVQLPLRRRGSSGKFLLAFRMDGDFGKRIIRTAHGAVEFLATGQQFVACGTHTSGARYEWVQGLPDEFPVVASDQFEALWREIERLYAIEPSTETSASTRKETLKGAIHNDPVAQRLFELGSVLSSDRDGKMHITCPYAVEHTTDGAESSTTYFPAHTGGYERGHFVCLHAHCAHRTDAEFLEAIGYTEDTSSDFDDLGPGVDSPGATADSGEVDEGDFSELPDNAPEEKPNRFSSVHIADFAAAQPLQWIVKGVLPKAELAVVFGESGSGKTFWIFDLVMAIARGVEWRGRKVKQGGVFYIAAEGAQGLRNRIRAYEAENKGQVTIEDLNVQMLADAPNLTKVDDVKDVIKLARTFKPAVIVVDTLAQTTAGANENSGEDMGKVLSHCKQLRKHTGAMVILIHHSGKDASRGARGWSGLRAAADCEIEITRSDADRVASITKLKDGEDGIEFGFKLRTVSLGTDEDGDAVTSCVVEYTTAVARASRTVTPLGEVEKIVMRTLDEMQSLGGDDVKLPELIANAVNQRVHDAASGKKDKRREHVLRALNTLQAKQKLRVTGDVVVLLTGDEA